MGDVSKETISANFVWRFLERCGAQIVTFFVSIVLARLLEPEVYGEIALVTVFSSILEVFVDSGLGNALIQKKNADNLDFSSVFYFNIVFCILLYGLMFFLAPFISAFYGKDLTAVIRVLCLVIVVSGIKNVQQAYISRSMLFKKFFFATTAGTIGAAIIGIYMAYRGYGVWALVVQNLFNKLVDTFILWMTVKWRPSKTFSFKRLRILFSYGWKLLVAQLFDTVYENCRSLIIGARYSSASLAFYNRGKQFPALILTNISSSMDSVLLPAMSKVQQDKHRIVSMLSRSIQLSSFIMIPLLFGLATIGEDLITILLTDKWLPCVPFMQVFCISMIFTPISLSNLNAIKAIGNSGTYLKLEIARKTIGVITLIVFMWFGPIYIAYSYLLNQVLGFILNSIATKKELGYGLSQQIKAILPSLSSSIFMSIIVFFVGKISINLYISLIMQICTGIVVYVCLSYVIKNDGLIYTLGLIKSFLRKKHPRKN